mmetsp:Transcript_16549/g.39743  ORF Transcript_16549/g.39743 Transcript_16549/m.39743 type:complete len:138 (-) Transcript_16549:502-915(-)
MHPWHMHGMQHASKRQPIRASIDMHTVTHHISPHSSNRWAHKGAAQGMDVCVDDEQTNTSTQPSPSATTRPLSPLHTRTPADRQTDRQPDRQRHTNQPDRPRCHTPHTTSQLNSALNHHRQHARVVNAHVLDERREG